MRRSNEIPPFNAIRISPNGKVEVNPAVPAIGDAKAYWVALTNHIAAPTHDGQIQPDCGECTRLNTLYNAACRQMPQGKYDF